MKITNQEFGQEQGRKSSTRLHYIDWLRVIADYRYTRNDSNVENAATGVQIFDYDRHQATLSLAARF